MQGLVAVVVPNYENIGHWAAANGLGAIASVCLALSERELGAHPQPFVLQDKAALAASAPVKAHLLEYLNAQARAAGLRRFEWLMVGSRLTCDITISCNRYVSPGYCHCDERIQRRESPMYTLLQAPPCRDPPRLRCGTRSSLRAYPRRHRPLAKRRPSYERALNARKTYLSPVQTVAGGEESKPCHPCARHYGSAGRRAIVLVVCCVFLSNIPII